MKLLLLSLNANYNEGLATLLIDKGTMAFAIVFMLLFLQALSTTLEKERKRVE